MQTLSCTRKAKNLTYFLSMAAVWDLLIPILAIVAKLSIASWSLTALLAIYQAVPLKVWWKMSTWVN